MNKKDYIINIRMFIISLFINLIMLYFAIDASNSAENSSEIAQESLNAIKDSNNLTMKTVKWYEEPQPLITYSTNLDYIGNNKTINLKIIPDYRGVDTTPWTWVVPIRITLYNSGRSPLMSPKLYINLTANNINNTFPFKIYKVLTPLDKIYYNEVDRKIYQSYEFPLIQGEKKDIPIIPQDYPPYLTNGEVLYPSLLNSYNTINEMEAIRQKVSSMGIFQKDLFGPFRIGTIEPDKKVEIEIWLFAITDGDYWEQLEQYWEKGREEKRTDACEEFWTKDWDKYTKCIERNSFTEYKTGNLEIKIEPETIESPINYSSDIYINFPLRGIF